jgi:hypothetical protein
LSYEIAVRTLWVLMCLAGGCVRFGAVYPSRPVPGRGAAQSDPEPARIVTHLTVTGPALQSQLNTAVPVTGEGSFTVLAAKVPYRWERKPLTLRFAQGRVHLTTDVDASLRLPVGSMQLPIAVAISAEPIINSDYAVRLQGVEVKVTTTDSRLKLADSSASALTLISKQLEVVLNDFRYELRPLLDEAHGRIAKPLAVPVGGADACARLALLSVEASPTILADGLEKDVALVVAPQVQMPCAADAVAPPLPPLANVSTLVPGPFTLTVPVAATYSELVKAMQAGLFTDGKLFFSKDYPSLFLSEPDLYESQGKLVLKLHVGGEVQKAGLTVPLDGDIFLWGSPQVVDNVLSLPDLEPTIETKNFFLSLKAMADADNLRTQARQALTMDLGARLRPVRERLSQDLTFGNSSGCFAANVSRIDIKQVFTHTDFLRVYVAVTALTSLHAPCLAPPPANAVSER